MDQFNVVPMGTSLGITYGKFKGMLGYELTYEKLTYSGDIIHDNVSNTIEHEQNTFKISLMLKLTKQTKLIAGYSYSKIEQTVGTSQSEQVDLAIAQRYELLQDYGKSGIHYGFSYDLFANKNYDLTISASRNKFEEGGYDDRIGLGIKISLKFNGLLSSGQ